MEIWPGKPCPLGATYDGTGVNFAIFTEVAERIELCLIGERGKETRVTLPEVDGFVWHGFLPGVQPGQRYGYRVHGPYEPPEGGLDDIANTEDSLGKTLTSVVINPFFDWGQDRQPQHEYHDTVIYEAHVKGLTKLLEDVPEDIRGTYAGIGHPATIEHLTKLGITAIELMPVHQFVQ